MLGLFFLYFDISHASRTPSFIEKNMEGVNYDRL